MHHHPNPEVAEAILGLLVDDHPTLWDEGDLRRAMSPTGDLQIEDALAAMHADGLVHRTAGCVFASRAAHACRALPS